MRYFEVSVWIVALSLLAFMSPTTNDETLCPFNHAGISFCPGCGLGHSISHLFHGNLAASFDTHPFGILAVIILIYRIISLLTMPARSRRENSKMEYN